MCCSKIDIIPYYAGWGKKDLKLIYKPTGQVFATIHNIGNDFWIVDTLQSIHTGTIHNNSVEIHGEQNARKYALMEYRFLEKI